MSRRTKAREVVAQMLYLVDLNPDIDHQTVKQMIIEQLKEPELASFAWDIFLGTREHRDDLDVRIQDVAANWKLFRMAPTDRNVLRMGAYELLQTDTPHRIVIDEALDVAKKFGNENSSAFCNGILDKLVPPEKRANDKKPE
ncbi:MAG: transcription antitermination factor NusB [Planctomycetaceae bacterium]